MSDERSNELGYGIRKDHWNLGIATEAGNAVIDKIKKAGYPYITATHDINNIASGIVMSKLEMSYKYSYVELVKPKNLSVTFRMYQLNFDKNDSYTYMGYLSNYKDHFIEDKSDF